MDQKGAYATVAPNSPEGSKRMQGRKKEILIAFFVMTLPMLVFSALLLGLIFYYRIAQNQFVSDQLALDVNQGDSNVYFVRISATTLITVASWSSTIAPTLVGFAITLASYPVAKGLLAASEKEDKEQLPTSFQLSLIVRMISSGSFSALWAWLSYSFGWKGKRKGQVKALRSLTIILSLGILLSALVLVTDTWLHFTTKTVNFFQVGPNPDASGLSFGVRDNCTDVRISPRGCNLNNPASGTILLSHQPMQVLSNISDGMSIPIHSISKDRYAYVANPQTSRLQPLDYTVKTYAVRSECTPVTSQCVDKQRILGTGAPYKCPFAFEGTVNTRAGAYNSVNMAYFTDSTGSDNQTDTTSIANPYYFSAMLLANMRNGRPVVLQEDPEFVAGGHGGATIVGIFCNATVYDVEYSSVNGTIRNWKSTKSNVSTTSIVQATQRITDVGNPNLVQATTIAGLANSTQDIADQFALAYSQTALGVATGAFEPRAALASQTRELILVARVPKTPLFVLIIANLLLVVLGLILTVVALGAARGDTGEVQARLSIPALVAALFERRVRGPVKEIEELFEERHNLQGPRLGLTKSPEGGWLFQNFGTN